MRLPTLILAASLIGCGTVQDFLENADKPTARVTGARIKGLSLSGLTLQFDLEVANPYSVALPLVGLDYALASRGTTFLDGRAEPPGSVPARGKKTIPLDAGVTFRGLLSVLSGVKPGAVVPYDVAITLAADAPAVGRIELPLKKSGELPIPTVPGIKLSKVQWGSLSLNEASATLHVALDNKNSFPLDLATFDYGLALGGASVASANIKQSKSMKAGGGTTLEIPISLSPIKLGLGVFNMLRGEDGNYRLAGTMAVGTPFGSLDMPFDSSGKTPFKR